MRKIALSMVMLASACSGQTSGESDMGSATLSDVVINELFPSGDSVDNPDFAELKNKGMTPTDLTGFKVRDSSLSHSFSIPAGTTIAPGEYLVIYCDDDPDGGVSGGLHASWKLSAKKGDEFHLIGPDGKDVDGTAFMADLASSKSWGRLPDGSGGFVPMTPTRGKPNF